LAALLAIIIANSPFHHIYALLIETPVKLQIGALEIAKPLLLWVNDGFMALFFFLVGLELKRECLAGELKSWRNAMLPGFGALGGMAVPALVYLIFNYDNDLTRGGWAIPAATDIAFALGVLSLLGPRVPLSLKIFLTSLAIFDDIGAILIIAFFYTSKISMISLMVSLIAVVALWVLNRQGIVKKLPYLCIGIIMWVAVLKSGVHATIAGVVLAMFIPMTPHARYPEGNTLANLEHGLHDMVIFFVLPIFAFCNSGVALYNMGFSDLVHPVPVGITLGLFIGKQVGVFSFCWLAIKMGIAKMPSSSNFKQLYGVSVLTGIGFTMSLFIGGLAFESIGADKMFDERLGILLGSLFSGVAGYFILRKALNESPETPIA